MYFKQTNKNYNRKACICNRADCKQLSLEFQQLGDIRGDFSTLPNPAQNSRKNNLARKVTFYNERVVVHLKLDKVTFSDNCYNKENPQHSTRSNVDVQRKKNSYVALHHYHPELLKTHGKNVSAVKNRFVDTQTMKAMNLYNAKGGSFYSAADLVSVGKGKHLVAVVPNYANLDQTKSDLADAKISRQLEIKIAQARIEADTQKRKRGREYSSTSSNSSSQTQQRQGSAQRQRLFETNVDDMDFEGMKKFVKKLQGESKKHFLDSESNFRESQSHLQEVNRLD